MADARIETFTGGTFDVFNPNPDDIRIEDIAHSLALQTRYGGHCKFPFSIAQHCVMGLKLVPDKLKLTWLLHDSAEAYVGDVCRPIKHNLDGFPEMESKVLEVIAKKYDIEYPFPKEIKDADNLMLVTEGKQIMNFGEEVWGDWTYGMEPLDMPIKYWSWEKAEYEFIKEFSGLMKERHGRQQEEKEKS